MTTLNSAPTVIVTGAARGIGLATAQEFFNHGYQVAMLDNNAAELAEGTTGFSSTDRIFSIETDVSRPSEVDRAVNETLERFGGIDALINNAGIADFMPAEKTSFEVFREILSVNLEGAFLCSQACAPVMLKQQHGAIVNITSISGFRASTLRTAYGTSKAALAHLTKQFAAEWGNAGIRVNAVAPGPIDTAMAKKVHSTAIREDYHNAIPLNRYGTEEEVAKVVYFLCSEDASYVNGQEIAVDGGFQSTAIGLATLRK